MGPPTALAPNNYLTQNSIVSLIENRSLDIEDLKYMERIIPFFKLIMLQCGSTGGTDRYTNYLN